MSEFAALWPNPKFRDWVILPRYRLSFISPTVNLSLNILRAHCHFPQSGSYNVYREFQQALWFLVCSVSRWTLGLETSGYVKVMPLQSVLLQSVCAVSSQHPVFTAVWAVFLAIYGVKWMSPEDTFKTRSGAVTKYFSILFGIPPGGDTSGDLRIW